MDFKQIVSIINQIAKERGIDAEKVLAGVEDSIATAYRKEYGERGEIIKAKINSETGDVRFWREKEVVDESTVRILTEEEAAEEAAAAEARAAEGLAPVSEPEEESEEKLPRYNPERHILLAEAKEIDPGVSLGSIMEFPLEVKLDFGRIAAQSAKQVILQKFREAEKDAVIGEYRHKEGKVVSGLIHRFDRGNVFVDLGRVSGIMFPNETIPGEHYIPNERMRFYVVAVQENRRGQPEIVLSRAHPNFIGKLFEMEVPEIADGTVEIKEVAREAGSRTKIAVHSNVAGVDPIGSCVGQRGTRVMAVTNELGPEKIDIIEWSEDPAKFIASSLSPASVVSVEVLPKSESRVIVPDDQLSLAIGKGGQNVRLAAKLTGWKIDVRSENNPEERQEDGTADSEYIAPVIDESVEAESSSDEGVLIPKKEEE
mgnify:CR=1 FL=1